MCVAHIGQEMYSLWPTELKKCTKACLELEGLKELYE